jgi:hypothetical protein
MEKTKVIKVKAARKARQPLIIGEYEVPNQLLLAYTYFIDTKSTKYISLGYNADDDFQPNIIIHHIGHSHIALNPVEWMSLFVNIEQVNKFFTLDTDYDEEKSKVDDVISAYKDINIRMDKKTNCIIISKNMGLEKVTLNRPEWFLILNLVDYINTVIFWYKSTINEVRNYYNEYLNKCLEYNLMELNASLYFSPSQISCNRYNYSRLFYEFPLICRMKICNDIINRISR